jgi:hypothetical protein
MTERIVIEDLIPYRVDALKITAVRRANMQSGLLISTNPYWNLDTFETQVFKLIGFEERRGQNVRPIFDFSENQILNKWYRTNDFENDSESALKYHHDVVFEIADLLELGELEDI